MKAEIVKQTNDTTVINWEDEDLGFGQLQLRYNGDGTYHLDAEYMGVKAVVKIIKALETPEF